MSLVPPRVLECRGTPREMGEAQGRDLKDSILRSVEICLDSEDLNPRRGSLLDARRLLACAGHLIDAGSYLRRDRTLRAWRDRVCGIADSAEIDRSLLFGLQAMEAFLVSPVEVAQCTTIGVTAERSAEQGPLMMKNYDAIELFRSTTILRRSAPARGLRTFEMALDVLAGSHLIVNEAGLVLSYNYGVANALPRPGIPPTFLVQQAAETCRDTPSAVDLLSRHPTTNGCLVTVLDAESDLCVVEKLGGRTAVRAAEHGVTATTNHFLTRELERHNFSETSTLSGLAPRAAHGLKVQAPNEERLRRARELILGPESAPRVSRQDLVAIAQDHDGKAQGDENTICRHHPYNITLASAILVPAEQRALVCLGSPCQETFHTLPFWA
ncbi:MAG: hypothetical protein JXB39_03040 [Deltaproteobacteria bacterium]|nr:hypothetical protein [Deltaproteobacteria bacterium]